MKPSFWFGLVAVALTLGGCAAQRSADSEAYFDAYSKRMLAEGRFRVERRPADAPYGPSDLARDFESVVFEIEENLASFYDTDQGEPHLSRWEQPILYRLVGDGVRPADSAAVAEVAAQLAAPSGLEIRPADLDAGETPNLDITLLTAVGRAKVSALISDMPGYPGSMAESWLDYLESDCMGAFHTEQPQGGAITRGSVYVKAEINDPLRRGCFVEEIAQLLGLPFDHDEVRPSIFNDDEEFLALTDHDLALIRILYDRRLKPGMTRAQAAPVVRRIVADRRLAMQDGAK